MSETIERFGKYLLLEKLAMGGMAEVYLAKSTGANGINKFVAVKRILPQYSDHPEFIEMFKEEAKIAVNLTHGNVVSIFDFGVVKSQFYLVMEYVEGRNLRQVLNHIKKQKTNFSLEHIVYIIKEVAAGLDHAHRCLDGNTGRPLNITHRDISPQNIMLSFEGEIKIVDFGIAKAETQLETTRAGTLKGKFSYMSPEHAEGQNLDLRTDIFSLGIVLWELLANDRLFISNNEANTLRKVRECQIPSLRKINPNIPAELERICNKTLARDRNLRYQTAAALHRDLNKFLNTHYPEYSTQDFSQSMKTLFADVIIENRRKLVEYSKIPLSDYKESTEITSTVTDTELPLAKRSNTTNSKDSLDISINSASAKVDLSSLKVSDAILSERSPKESSITFSNVPRHKTQTGIHKEKVPQNKALIFWQKHSNQIVNFSIISILALMTYMFLQNKFFGAPNKHPDSKGNNATVADNTPPESTIRQVEMSQTGVHILHLQSEPEGAQIFIDGKDIGYTTPARVTVKANTPFNLTLKKEGFLAYERRLKTRNDTSFKATIQRARVGYLDINVVNPGSNTILYINGERLAEKPPLNRYAVPAGTQIQIRAENPFARTSAQTTVSVGTDQKRSVQLILEKTRQPTNQ